MASSVLPMHDAAASPLWRVAQWVGLAATVALLAGLIWWPEPSLLILWNAIVPLVPASLLISPFIWRNVCPLASLNTIANRSQGQALTPALMSAARVISILLLLVLVPARRFLFNQDGVALAITIAAVGVLALLLGSAFRLKAGFCNSICPVLPVEQLYGQRPLRRVVNARCAPCTMCTPEGCVDLVPGRSILTAVGEQRRSHGWLLGPVGAFVAAFPGFVVGYYTLQDGPLAGAVGVYGHIALYMAISYVATAALTLILGLDRATVTVLLASTAAALYYWYAAPAISEAFDIGTPPIIAIRVVAGLLVLYWLVRALPRGQHSGAHAA